MQDIYLKVVLTFMAFTQLLLAVKLLTPPAEAQGGVQRVLVVNEYVPVVGRSAEAVNVRLSSPGNGGNPIWVKIAP